jgi:nucleotide-binding universal stress UspA family protein
MALATILAGCDLSIPSDQAIDRAICLAALHRARLVLVHAHSSDSFGSGTDNAIAAQLGELSAAIRAEETGRLAHKLAEIEARGLEAAVISRPGPPDEVLAAAAEDEAADLLVIGTHGHTGLSRFLLGSVAAATIRRAPCDVLVSRGSASPAGFTRPLLATDFSPQADQALARVTDYVSPGTPIVAVHAWQLPPGSWGGTLLGQARFPWSTVRDAVLSTKRAQCEALVASHGQPLHIELVQGAPAAVITETAERGKHDLIVIGAHGKRGFRRWLLGSVAESTVRHAPCSVLVVHVAPK